MKLPFRRRDKEDVPAEIKEYYQAERRERVGVAWAVALLTLLITVGIVMGLFFGGRWLYRTLANRDQNQTATTQNQPPEQAPQSGDTADRGDTAPNPSPSSPADPGPSQQGSQPDGASQTGPNSQTAQPPASSPPAASNTGPAARLPDNGPGEVLGAAAVVAIISGMLHRSYWRRRI